MGFDLSVGISAVTVFLQGLLSVFSPCVLPLIPLYIGYLAGGTAAVQPDGTIRYPRRRVLVNTLFFVLGISFAFFLLGMGFTALGRFFSGNRTLFTRCSGVRSWCSACTSWASLAAAARWTANTASICPSTGWP